MNAKSLLAVALILCPLNNASAEDVTHDAKVTFAPGQKAPSIHIPMPDAKRGLPDGMAIQMVVALRGVAGVENLAKGASQAVLFTNYGADLTAFGGQLQLAAGGQFAQSRKLGSYDGASDFAGSSGTVFALRNSSEMQSQRFAGKRLDEILQGIGSAQMTLDVNGGAAASLIGLSDADSQSRLFVIVQVRVTYKYFGTCGTQLPNPKPNSQPQLNGLASQAKAPGSVVPTPALINDNKPLIAAP